MLYAFCVDCRSFRSFLQSCNVVFLTFAMLLQNALLAQASQSVIEFFLGNPIVSKCSAGNKPFDLFLLRLKALADFPLLWHSSQRPCSVDFNRIATSDSSSSGPSADDGTFIPNSPNLPLSRPSDFTDLPPNNASVLTSFVLHHFHFAFPLDLSKSYRVMLSSFFKTFLHSMEERSSLDCLNVHNHEVSEFLETFEMMCLPNWFKLRIYISDCALHFVIRFFFYVMS
ncbi:hypothetical protein VNO77_22804 [Canavalia gladiata]|uniref:Uncharacterized protein n=1 Tax=Canavalia gladiata TaxID=3824 RepID=A0AAN9L5V3_CANGL